MGSIGNTFNITSNKEINRLIKTTSNLKKEQYRIIDSNGNVLIVKKGSEHEVSASVGEKREYLNGNLSLHNHPAGGTFSPDDLSDFGYGAVEIIASAPEGSYHLVNTRIGKSNQYNGWSSMQRDMITNVQDKMPSGLYLIKQARENVSNTNVAKELKAISEEWNRLKNSKGVEAANAYAREIADRESELGKLHKKEVDQERRRLETAPYHEYFKKNASKYGFKYVFKKKNK